MHLSRTNINGLSYPLNRAYVQVFHVQDRTSISWCQFYMNQLPVELLIDSKRLWYLMKLEKTGCPLMSHVFGISSIKYIETLLVKYEIIGSSANDRRLSKAALMKSYGGGSGSGIGQMNLPCYLAIDRTGFILVADQNNNRIIQFNA